MKTARIPLVGSYNLRAANLGGATDQRLVNIIFTIVNNIYTNTRTAYAEKRPGLLASLTPASGSVGVGVFMSPFSDSAYTAFGATTSTIYTGTTSRGTLSGCALHFSEVILGSVAYVMITSNDQTGWFLASDSVAQTAYTGTTHTNTTVDGIASTAGMYAGQLVTKADFQANTRIASVDSANQITITLAATGSSTGTITKTPLAKIIDADFPTNIVGQFVDLDGTIYIATATGKVYGSDINSVTSWSASNFIASNIFSDNGVGLGKIKNYIVSFGTASGEFFYNAGNPSGSLLSSSPQLAFNVGAIGGSVGGSVGKSLIASGFDILTWVGRDTVLYMMEGTVPKPLTGPADKVFATGSLPAGSFTLDVFFSFQLKVISLNGQAWYFPDLKLMAEVSAPGTTTFFSSTGNQVVYSVMGGADTSGKLYTLSPTTYQDNGSSISITIRTSRLTHGTNKRKFVKEIRLIGDSAGQGTVTLKKSDDDYATTQTLGTFDMTLPEPKINRCGSYKGGRSYTLEHSGNTPMRVEALEIDYEESDV